MALTTQNYSPVATEDGFGDEKIANIDPTGRPTKHTMTAKINLSLGVAVLAGVFMLGFATSHLLNKRHTAPVYNTDFAPIRNDVGLEQVLFSASPSWDDNGTVSLIYNKNETRYTGLPVEAVDKAWDDLIGIRYFLVSDEEAQQALGPSYKQYYRYPDRPKQKGGYPVGIDVLHTLHCVNKLRIALYRDHYPPVRDAKRAFAQYHIDHCIEILRQSIQCNGDLTPIPTRWWPGIGRNFIDSNQVHTCRDFSKIREFARQRYRQHHRPELEEHLPPVQDKKQTRDD